MTLSGSSRAYAMECSSTERGRCWIPVWLTSNRFQWHLFLTSMNVRILINPQPDGRDPAGSFLKTFHLRRLSPMTTILGLAVGWSQPWFLSPATSMVSHVHRINLRLIVYTYPRTSAQQCRRTRNHDVDPWLICALYLL